MKYLFCPLLIFLASLQSLAQAIPPQSIENNLYYKAFAAYLEKRNAMYEGNEYLKTQEYLRIYVESDLHLNDTFPGSVGRHTIEYLDYVERKEKFDKTRNPFRLVVFRPMKNDGGRLIISFAEYLWSYKKNKISYALSDGASVDLVFDCDKKEFVVDKVSLWGI